MTNKEALIAVVSLPDLSDFELEKALLDNDVPAGDYSKSNSKGVDIAAIDILRNRIHVASQSEGSFSISFNISGAKAKIIQLANKHDMPDLVAELSEQPKIKDITDMW